MTIHEAKIILALRETDEPTRDGLLEIRKSRERIIGETASAIEKRRARKEIAAIDKLLSHVKGE